MPYIFEDEPIKESPQRFVFEDEEKGLIPRAIEWGSKLLKGTEVSPKVELSPLTPPVVTPPPPPLPSPPPPNIMARMEEIVKERPGISDEEIKEMISGEYTPEEITAFGREYSKPSLVGKRKKVVSKVEKPKEVPKEVPIKEWEFVLPLEVRKDWEKYIKPSNVVMLPPAVGKPELAISHIPYSGQIQQPFAPFTGHPMLGQAERAKEKREQLKTKKGGGK